MKRLHASLTTAWIVLLFSCGGNTKNNLDQSSAVDNPIAAPANLSYTVINSYPHDTAAFTQGLEVYQNNLLESTGLFGRSSLRRVDIQTGRISKSQKLDSLIFAEGLTVFNDTIYQLSWENHLVFMYAAKDFKPIGQLPWTGEGWGITHDDNNLIISEGSDKLYFVEPHTLKLKKIVSVKDQLGAVNNLNELEFIDGYVYANRWQYDYILKIDPNSGYVVGMINLQDFLQKNSRADLSYLKREGSTAMQSGAVLNGIAYNKKEKTLFITGKLWPEIFEIRLQ
jgi:glutamine cyclotransferase